MAAYRLVYDSCHLQADCQEPGSAPGPYAGQSTMGYFYLLAVITSVSRFSHSVVRRGVQSFASWFARLPVCLKNHIFKLYETVSYS